MFSSRSVVNMSLITSIIHKKLVNLKLEHKILLSTICIEILYVVLFLLAGMSVVTSRYDRLLYQSTLSSSALVSHEFANRLEELESMSNVVRADITIQSVLDEISNPTTKYASNYYSSIYSTLQKYYLQYKHDYIRFAAISCPRFVAYTYGYIKEHPSDDILMSIIQEAKEADGSAVWLTENAHENGLYLVREIKKIEHLSLNDLGTFIVKVDFDKLISEVSTVSQDFKSSYWILYDHENLIYASSDLTEQAVSDISCQSDDYGIITVNGIKYFYTRGEMENTHWDYIQLISYQDIANSQKDIMVWYLLVLLLGLLFSVIMMHIIIRKTTRHIDLLILRMKQFGNNSIDLPPVPSDYTQRTDEIGMLHQQFDSMAQQIQTLITQNYQQELLTKEAQLKSLESQMNPHFLYNTLESVNWRAKAIGEKDISQMVEALGHFLRITLNRKNDIFTLREELALIQYYMTIQQLRYENRLNYHLDIPVFYQDAMIPKLSIQPLLENAVHYALEQITDDCTITLTCTKTDNLLQIYVKNTGSEFQDHLLDKLRNHEIKENGLGIALLNIQERVQLMFGVQYGLSFYNENDYAVVKLEIPYLQVNQVTRGAEYVKTDDCR